MTQKVFFLGAGFSKAVNSNYPLMDELTKQVFERLEKESVRKHLDEIPEQVKQNIESLLTYLSTDFPWKTDTTKYANLALYAAIIQILSDIFSNYAQQEQKRHYSNTVFGQFSNAVLRYPNIYHFITLNYDVLLEQLLSERCYRPMPHFQHAYQDFYSYPISWVGDRESTHTSSRVAFSHVASSKILKLHGSANWFWAGESPSDILYYQDWMFQDPSRMTRGLKPYIIPPVQDKNAFYNHIAIRSLWQQAAQLLEKADEIYIIGFSFPQTDLAVKYLFQSALRNRDPKVYVVNTASLLDLEPLYEQVFKLSNLNYDYTEKPDAVERFIKEIILTEGHQ